MRWGQSRNAQSLALLLLLCPSARAAGLEGLKTAPFGLPSLAATVPNLPAGAEATLPGVVLRNNDGDTMALRLEDGTTRKIRLYGVDAPESSQPFGPEAQAFTQSLTAGRSVHVVVRETDDYGRLLGTVVLPDGRSLNRELVRAGLAWWYRYFSPELGGDYGRLEEAARGSRLGLWAQDKPEAPWDFRRRTRPRG
ncbi:MAG: thermonuclease family protein [Elusimicrobia bacterium]|nr:thermonuclease family protein [Elusimicrobiota bacterium]